MTGQPISLTFEEARPKLLGLAYRILGSRADAEDAVQDTFLKWQAADCGEIGNPAAWLTTACTRRCLDLLRAAHRSRVSYVGAWLPEPIHTPIDNEAETRLELASTLTTAFLLMLERLTPKERAAYLLHDIFDRPYDEVAVVLGVQEAACRKLVSRARAGVDRPATRYVASAERQEALLAAFRSALDTGHTDRLSALLADDIALSADGGGKASALGQVLTGRQRVLDFLTGPLRGFWAAYRWQPAEINGGLGALLLDRDGGIVAAVSFGYDAVGRVDGIFVMRNPDKLARLERGGVAVA